MDMRTTIIVVHGRTIVFKGREDDLTRYYNDSFSVANPVNWLVSASLSLSVYLKLPIAGVEGGRGD
jgi:hypothetical protein